MKISEAIERAINCSKCWDMPYRVLVKDETRSILIQPTDHGIPEGFVCTFTTEDIDPVVIDTHTVGEGT